MALPAQLLEILRGYPGNYFDGIADAMSEPPVVSLKFNPRKAGAQPDAALASDFGPIEPVPWFDGGVYLAERPAFTFYPELHQGVWYVQDAASMFIGHVLRHLLPAGSPPVRYLDACAAPGGKTTVAIDCLPEGSVVVANEYVAQRAAVLRENLTKWGSPSWVVTQGDTSRFAAMTACFDIVAADVPCSGEGMMRKDRQAVDQWSPQLVEQCARTQRQIVENLWPALRPGGYLIYSTCTFNRVEDEENVRWIIDNFGAEPVAIPTQPDWGIAPAIGESFPAYRFIPGRTRGEGLFMAVLRKPDDAVEPQSRRKSSKKENRKNQRGGKQTPLPKEARGWITDGEMTAGEISLDPDGRIFASAATAFEGFPLKPRIEIGQLKGRDAIPSQALAMSALLAPEAFPTAEIDRQTAIQYLRCEAIRLPEAAPRGILLLTYAALPLGFVKNLGPRANNLYPKPWRILSQSPSR